MKSFSVFLCFVGIIATVASTDYCAKDICRRGRKHIGCRPKDFDRNCLNPEVIHIDRNLQAIILDEHNKNRNNIAGGAVRYLEGACSMGTMQWDQELADLAALNVKQCKMNHDECRNTDSFKNAGQNLYLIWDSVASNEDIFKRAVQYWYDEVRLCQQRYIDSFPNDNKVLHDVGHFTVMVADRNIRVGCSALRYSLRSKPKTNYFLIACNYATTNMISEPIYTKCRQPGRDCKSGKHPQYKFLCDVNEEYKLND